ncbi:dnaJ homolog subfamily C member 3-like [Macrobrachium rosenbergii]|uniref:dnaJ homolog subfamily C member 3-like n=1 Tax=Macrobrachium rosenbergii TaxID=79674 RepID=UPI0034D691CE
MTALSEVYIVLKSLLALILTRSVIPFKQRKWIQNIGLFIVKIAVVLVLGGFVGHVHQYIEGQKALQIAQDPTAPMDDDDDKFYATEMTSLLKEERKDAKDEMNDRKSKEAAVMRTNEELLDELMEGNHNCEKPRRHRDLAEQENERLKKKIEELEEALIQKAKEVENQNEQLAAKEEECDRSRKELEELRTQAVDNDFYCGYLEDKVKTHEAERRRLRLIEATTRLIEERLPASQPEVSVLAINPDLERNHDDEAQKSPGLHKKVHTLEETVPPVQQENKKRKKKKLPKRECKETVIDNSMPNEKHKNIDVMEETKGIGNVFCKLGHLEQASECFLRVLHMDDDQVDCRIKLGLCLLLLGRHSEAVVQLEELKDREDLVAAAKTLQRMQRHGCPYYVLGVPEDATSKEIEWAYMKRALKFSPDRCRGSNEERERLKEIMQKINFANDLLCDADERREYDAVRESIKDLADKAFQDTQFPRQ